MKKKIFINLIALVLMFCLMTVSSAHNPNQHGYVFGGENVGWRIDEIAHHSDSNMRYWFNRNDSNLDNAKKNFTRNGAALWSSPYIVTEVTTTPTPIGTGHINTVSSPADPETKKLILAEFSYTPRIAANPPNGHINVSGASWGIVINRHVNAASHFSDPNKAKITMAHEFGHACGLKDLYDDVNKNKLMYSISNFKTATRPTTADRHGASVMTGQHTHSTGPWPLRYRDKNWTPNNKMRNRHSEGCSICGGFKGTVIGGSTTLCNLNGSNGGCETCKIHRNGDVTQNGVVNNTDAERILSYIAGHRTFSSKEYYLADVNGDGKITMIDVLEIQKFINNMSSSIIG